MNSLYALASLWAALTAPDLQWGDHYGTARKQAIASGKPLLVVIERERNAGNAATSSSSMANVSWNDHQTTRELLANYELCRIDGDSDYGRRVAKAFKASRLPMTAIVDKTGEWTVFIKTGDLSTQALNDALREWKEGVASAEFVARILERRRHTAEFSLESQARLCRT